MFENISQQYKSTFFFMTR